MARNTSVTLGNHFDQFVVDKIQQGRFQSVSEVIRAGLRILEQDEAKLQALRTKLKAGEDSPTIHGFDRNNFLDRMHHQHDK